METSIGDNVTIHFDQQSVFRLQGFVRPEDKPDERCLALYDDMSRRALELAAPRGLFNEYKIVSMSDESISLGNGITLKGKNIAKTFRGSDSLFVGLVTIGPELEKEVSLLFDEHKYAEGLMLDCLGSDGAESVADYIDGRISEIVTARGQRRTPRMSPGYGSFLIDQQEQLFKLFDSPAIGISLSSSYIMTPRKSVSFIIGSGQNVRVFRNLSPCSICDEKDCPARNLDSSRCQH